MNPTRERGMKAYIDGRWRDLYFTDQRAIEKRKADLERADRAVSKWWDLVSRKRKRVIA